MDNLIVLKQLLPIDVLQMLVDTAGELGEGFIKINIYNIYEFAHINFFLS